jgi:hypothetical protein
MEFWKIIALIIYQHSVYDDDDDDDDDDNNTNNNNNNVGKNKLFFVIIPGHIFWSGLSENILWRVDVK